MPLILLEAGNGPTVQWSMTDPKHFYLQILREKFLAFKIHYYSFVLEEQGLRNEKNNKNKSN